MVGNNGAVTGGVGALGERCGLDELPEPDLPATGRSVLERRYLSRNPGAAPETARDRLWSVAVAIAQANGVLENEEAQARRQREYYRAMARLDFLPSSNALANAGRGEEQPLLPGYALALDGSCEAILETGRRAARIRALGGSVGLALPPCDVAPGGVDQRPASDRVLELCGAVARLTPAGGGGIQVLVPVDHPDILALLEPGPELGERQRVAYEMAAAYLGPEQRAALRRALASASLDDVRLVIGLTDRFMLAVVRGDDYELRNPASGSVAGPVPARDVFGRIVRSVWERGRTEVLFLDRLEAGRANPVPDLGPLRAVTADGEVLYADEGCAVGHLNLARFHRPRPPRNGHAAGHPGRNGSASGHAGFSRHPAIDWERLGRATRLAVRFLDDLLSASPQPDQETRRAVEATRRLGLGVMGWADLLMALEVPYDSPQAIDLADEVMRFVGETATDESCILAESRGPFPAWDRSIHVGGRPRRNATVTTVAGTGSVSLIAGCSSGIEPLATLLLAEEPGGTPVGRPHPALAEVARREGFWNDELSDRLARTDSLRRVDGAPEYWQRVFVTAADVAPEWHIRMQAAFQRHADNAVAKTIRLPRAATIEDVESVFRLAYELGCHGVAVHRDGLEPLVHGGSGEGEASRTGGPEHLRARPWMLQGLTFQEETPLGTAYVTVNVDQEEQPFEVFVNQGKTGSDVAALSVAIGKLSSLVLRLPSPMTPEQRLREVARRLRGIGGGSTWRSGPERARSLPDALARVLERYLGQRAGCAEANAAADRVPSAQLALPLAPTGEFCAECSNALHFEEGASKCRHCGTVRA